MKTQPRQRPENVKQQVVEAREFEDIRLVKEHVAEFRYRPVKCQQDVSGGGRVEGPGRLPGQKKLFDDARCFFYITNDWEKPAEEIVFEANDRCNQENLLAATQERRAIADGAGGQPAAQLGVHGDGLAGLEPEGLGGVDVAGGGPLAGEAPGGETEAAADGLQHVPARDDATFRRRSSRTGRKIVYRLLAWNPWQHVFFRLLDQLRQPLRC